MGRRSRDDDAPEDVFGLVGQLLEGTIESVDTMLGPFATLTLDIDTGSGGRTRPEQGPTAEYVPDTHVDAHADGDRLRIVADIPGTTMDDLDVRCDTDTVTIAVAGDRRTHEHRLDLPVAVDPDSATATFNNGVLEVTVRRQDRSDEGPAVEAE